MSSIDVLDILEEVCAGDDNKHIDVLLAYIDELEDATGIIDKLSSLKGDKVVIRALEGYTSFLQLLIDIEREDADEEDDYSWPCDCEVCLSEVDEYDEQLSTDYDTALNAISEMFEYDRLANRQKDRRGVVDNFENSIKGTDYAYGGFMSEDDD